MAALTETRPVRAFRPRLPRLVYQSESSRDLRLDFLRGLAVLAMVVDHLAGPSRLYILTGGNRFFTSAAEGFVLISGLVVGMVYKRIAERDGIATSLRRLLERAWALYVLAVGLTLLVLPASELLNLPWAQGVDTRDPLLLLWSIVTGHRTYYLVDIPLLYALLLAVAPLALLLMHERRTWIVLAASGLLWLGFQVYPAYTDFPWPIEGNYLFNFSAWQVLFIAGMVLGYHRERLRAPSPLVRRLLLVATGIGFAALVVLYRHTEALLLGVQSVQAPGPSMGGLAPSAQLVDLLFAKGPIGPGRLVASAVVFTFLYLLAHELWGVLRRLTGWLLIPLGQNALYAYSLHVLAAVGIAYVAGQVDLDVKTAADVNLRIQLASVAVLWVAIRLRLFVPNERNRRWWMLAPVPLALAVVGLMRSDPTPELPGFQAPPAGVAAAQGRAANRFGTPLPRDAAAQARAANRFGTPLPRDQARAGAPGPGAVATPRPFSADMVGATPAPLPAPAEAVLARPQDTYGAARPSEYVGETLGIFRERTFYSPSLDREMAYYVYLPPLYGTENRRYPVLYMLHGGGQHRDEWPAYGFVDAADRMMASKELRPFIIVLPQGDYSYWINHPDEGELWGDYVALDLVRQVDSSFRTLPAPDKRAVGGLSMGGLGALHLSFLHPDVFRNAGAHSPALYPDDGSMPLLGQGEDFAARDPVLLALNQPGVEHVDIAIDIGEEDYFIERVMELHDVLDLRGIPHAFNVLPGVHGDGYWERNIVNYLRLYDSMLNWR